MAEYLVQSESLTSVANAIRTKGGTTEALSFPDGFVSAVEGIQAGGNGVSEQDLIDGMAKQEWPSGDIVINEPVIKASAFRFRNAITGVKAPNATALDGYAFAYCLALKHIEIPLVTKLQNGSFEGCSSLMEISLPKAPTIGTTCFNSCNSLAKIDAGTSMARILSRSIQNCYALETLILRSSTVVSIDNVNAFNNTPISGYNGLTGTVYVPSALIEQYQRATNWSTLYSAGTCNFVAIEGSEYE